MLDAAAALPRVKSRCIWKSAETASMLLNTALCTSAGSGTSTCCPICSKQEVVVLGVAGAGLAIVVVVVLL